MEPDTGHTPTRYANDVLVERSWLERHLSDDSIRIVEVDENPALYLQAHIPGAIGLDWRQDLQHPVKRGFLDHEAFGRLLGLRGISNRHVVVLYGDETTGSRHTRTGTSSITVTVTRSFSTALASCGSPRAARLSAQVAKHAAETFIASPETMTIRARRGRVLDALDGPHVLVDVRSPHEYSGRPSGVGCGSECAHRARAHPGSEVDSVGHAVNEDGTFKSVGELRAAVPGNDVLAGRPIISYCPIGERSAHTWFVLHELLGAPDVKNYDGSWTEWGNLVDVPIEKD